MNQCQVLKTVPAHWSAVCTPCYHFHHHNLYQRCQEKETQACIIGAQDQNGLMVLAQAI